MTTDQTTKPFLTPQTLARHQPLGAVDNHTYASLCCLVDEAPYSQPLPVVKLDFKQELAEATGSDGLVVALSEELLRNLRRYDRLFARRPEAYVINGLLRNTHHIVTCRLPCLRWL